MLIVCIKMHNVKHKVLDIFMSLAGSSCRQYSCMITQSCTTYVGTCIYMHTDTRMCMHTLTVYTLPSGDWLSAVFHSRHFNKVATLTLQPTLFNALLLSTLFAAQLKDTYNIVPASLDTP